MMPIKKNMWTALLLVACILIGAVFATNVRADDEEYNYPTLYCNDEVWYKSDIYPLDSYGTVYYVPASIFARFDGVTVTPNERFETLLISYGKSGAKYISFNTNTDLALTDKFDEFHAMTYTKDGERYVPAEVVCKALGFSFEYKKSNRFSITAMRICDGNQKKSFAELVALFSNGDDVEQSTPPVSETTDVPIVDPPVPMNTKTVYITLDHVGKGEVDSVLSVLRQNNVKATFFLSIEELNDESDKIIKIIAAGHSVGFSFNTSGYWVDCLKSFKEQNELFMKLAKKSARVVQIYGEKTEDDILSAKAAEYSVCGWDIFFDENVESALAEMDSVLNDKDMLTIRFSGENYCAGNLVRALEKISEYNVKTRAINDATSMSK